MNYKNMERREKMKREKQCISQFFKYLNKKMYFKLIKRVSKDFNIVTKKCLSNKCYSFKLSIHRST